MTTTPNVSARRRRTRLLCVGLAAVVMLAIVFIAWQLYAVSLNLFETEKSLLTTVFTIRLVDQYVHENGRWPKSWSELEQMSFPSDAPSPLNSRFRMAPKDGGRGYEWPAQSAYLQDYVAIDFRADVDAIIGQDPKDFDAIMPSNARYNTPIIREQGYVEMLQKTLAKSRRKAAR